MKRLKHDSVESKVQDFEAPHGEKMIEVKIRFWTDKIAAAGKIRPKHAWSGGIVRLETNASHGLHAHIEKTFNSLMEISSVLEKVLIEEGVVLHPSRKMKKYFMTDD